MKLQNYRKEDIELVVDLKKMALHQIEALEICNWTDDLDSAIVRIEILQETFKRLREMKYSKALGSRTEMLAAKLIAQGINAQAMQFANKKAD